MMIDTKTYRYAELGGQARKEIDAFMMDALKHDVPGDSLAAEVAGTYGISMDDEIEEAAVRVSQAFEETKEMVEA